MALSFSLLGFQIMITFEVDNGPLLIGPLRTPTASSLSDPPVSFGSVQNKSLSRVGAVIHLPAVPANGA